MADKDEEMSLADTTYIYSGIVGTDARLMALTDIVTSLIAHLLATQVISPIQVVSILDRVETTNREIGNDLREGGKAPLEGRTEAANQLEREVGAMLQLMRSRLKLP